MHRRWLTALLLVATVACDAPDEAPTDTAAEAPMRAELGGEPAPGFARATEPRTFEFPADHGPHPDYRNEWWYLVGNVEDDAGHRFGFQVTFFRIGLAPGSDERDSAWATRQVWMAHLALTDVAGEAHHHAERFARDGAIGLAGAEPDGGRIWLEDWELRRDDAGNWHLRAATVAFRLDLALAPQRAPVLHGDGGLSQKSAERGNASYYYSKPRLATHGSIGVGDAEHAVTGSAWLDREWSTSVLGEAQEGWDWFALQLEDGTDVMVYEMRRFDRERSDYSYAAIMAADGEVTRLGPEQFTIEAMDQWTSPDGTTYPSQWRLTLEPLDEPLEVVTVVADQELTGTVRYWEGAVDVHARGVAVGRGYVELAGYADE